MRAAAAVVAVRRRRRRSGGCALDPIAHLAKDGVFAPQVVREGGGLEIRRGRVRRDVAMPRVKIRQSSSRVHRAADDHGADDHHAAQAARTTSASTPCSWRLTILHSSVAGEGTPEYPWRHVHPGRGTSGAHLRRHRRRIRHQRRLGRQGADREGAAGPSCSSAAATSSITDYPTATMETLAVRAAATGCRTPDVAKQEKQNRTGYTTHPVVDALVRQRRRESLHRGQALRLVSRLSRRRPLADVGAPVATAGATSTSRRTPREGVGVDWPIRYADIAPWYDHVERFAGISGSTRGPAAAARRPVPAADAAELRRGAWCSGAHRARLRRPAR